MNYKKALETIVQKRKDRLNEAKEVYLRTLWSNQKLYEIETDIRRLTLLEIKGEKDCSVQIRQLEAQKQSLLDALGITSNMLSPEPLCGKCGDSGLKNGKICDCVKRMAIQIDENIALPLNRFSLSDKAIERDSGLSKLYEHMRSFVKKFPDTNTKNIVLLGSTGTGKTFLASCIAGELLMKGFSVVFLTAFGVQQRMLNYHTSFDSQKEQSLLPLLDCDLLIIDDLGTESILKNVTLEYLYIIINERIIKGKHTIITTNLSMTDMAVRYGEKLTSRLFDKKTCLSKVLSGLDLRKINEI